MNAVMVRVAYAGPRLRKGTAGEPGAGTPPGDTRLLGCLVVLADDAGHRALPAWLVQEPGSIALPDLPHRPADDIWTTASVPEELAVRLAEAAGGNVTGVRVYPVTADPGEVNADTCAAWIELGARRVTARLEQGLGLAVVAGAPVTVDAELMGRLAVPLPDGDPTAPFLDDGPSILFPGTPPGRRKVLIERREGRVLHLPEELPGERPRFEPRNMAFAEGLDRWHLDRPGDYAAAVAGSAAVLSSAVSGPSGSAMLLQTVFADDFRGARVAFRAEFRTEGVVGRAGLGLQIMDQGWEIDPDRFQERVVTVAGSRDWSWEEVSLLVSGNANVIRFGIVLTGRGRVWLRNPELRLNGTRGQ